MKRIQLFEATSYSASSIGSPRAVLLLQNHNVKKVKVFVYVCIDIHTLFQCISVRALLNLALREKPSTMVFTHLVFARSDVCECKQSHQGQI